MEIRYSTPTTQLLLQEESMHLGEEQEVDRVKHDLLAIAKSS